MTKWNVPDTTDTPKLPLHPEGTYDAIVVSAKASKTKNGKDMLVIDLKTGQGKVTTRLTHSPESDKAVWAFFKQLANMGVDQAFFDKDPDIEDVAMELVKARVMIDVSHEEYKGSPVATVGWINGPPESAI